MFCKNTLGRKENVTITNEPLVLSSHNLNQHSAEQEKGTVAGGAI